MQRVIYCADIGSVPKRRFGWARAEIDRTGIEQHYNGPEIVELVDHLTTDLTVGRPIALGFECPAFVLVPTNPQRLGQARTGEGNRSWSAGAGAGAMATGVVEIAWILRELRQRCPNATAHQDWHRFAAAGTGLFVWEAHPDTASHTENVGAAV